MRKWVPVWLLIQAAVHGEIGPIRSVNRQFTPSLVRMLSKTMLCFKADSLTYFADFTFVKQ